MPFIQKQRSRTPDDQGWIAYEATAARLMDQPLYRELYDYARFVRTYDLEAPAGWPSMAELNAALLRGLAARHPFATHPLDQSLRNGSQSARSLLTDPDPAIRAILQAFEGPIEDYRRSIGAQPGHPLTSRNRGATQFSGAWSVQLRREGFHVNHFHPQGWISSAYYVSVPEEVSDVNTHVGLDQVRRDTLPGAGRTRRNFHQAATRASRPVSRPICGTGPTRFTGPSLDTTIAFDAVPTSIGAGKLAHPEMAVRKPER